MDIAVQALSEQHTTGAPPSATCRLLVVRGTTTMTLENRYRGDDVA